MSLAPVLRNLGSGTAARLLSAGLGLVLLIAMARIWSPAQFGEYLIAFNLFQLLQQTPLLGLHYLLARDVAARRQDMQNELATATLFGVCVATMIGAGLWLALRPVYPATLHPMLLWVGAALVPSAAIMVLEMALTGQERLWLVAAVNIVESIARLVVFATMIVLGADAASVFAAFLVLRCLALAVYLLDPACRHQVAPHAIRYDALQRHLRRVPVLFSILLLAAAFSRLDVAMLSWMVAPETVAAYAVATRCYDLMLMVPSILVTVLLPILSRLDHRGQDLAPVLGLILRYGLIAGLPAAALVAVLAEPMLAIAFGPAFTGAADVTRVLTFATVVMAINQLVACVLLVRDMQRLDLACLASGVLALVMLLPPLVSALGIVGAALAVLAASTVQCGARLFVLRRTLLIDLAPGDFAGPMTAFATMAVILWLGRDVPLLAIPVALLAFAAVLMLLRIVRNEHLAATRTLIAAR